MTSKERVALTIAHKEPDRVPVGEWGIDHDHVSNIIGHHTYWRNRKDTTLAMWDNRRDEVVESLKNDCVELVDKLEYDIVTVEQVPPKNSRCENPPKSIADGVWEDSSGNIFKYASSNDSIMHVLSKNSSPEGRYEITQDDINKKIASIDKIDESTFELVDFISQKYGNEKAILFRGMGVNGYLTSLFGGDFNHQLIISLMCPDEIKKMYNACFLYHKKILEMCKERNVMIVMEGHDYGMNTGCMMKPDSIKDIFVPAIKMVNMEAHRQGMIPFFHSCGKVWDIMDDFVDAGYKGYQSIQESAGMDTRTVKEKYGKDLTLWTGIQCETLILATKEETAKEVSDNLDFLMPGGGFVFGSTNSVQYGAKTDNYLSGLEVVRTKGVY